MGTNRPFRRCASNRRYTANTRHGASSVGASLKGRSLTRAAAAGANCGRGRAQAGATAAGATLRFTLVSGDKAIEVTTVLQ